MSLIRVVLALASLAIAPAAHAKGENDQDDEEDPDADAEDESSSDEEVADEEPVKKPKSKPENETDFVKQDLSGHDLGTNKRENSFEKDRFFVDKVDTAKTANGTLIQGSLTSSSFVFTETGGAYPGTGLGENSAKFSRYFTELRLQTDFRHISGSRWEARVDARARVVNAPPDGATSADPTRVQSGFIGRNEYDVRELWLFRSGKRSDLFFGRQFVADLGAIKFDGLRVDYASSQKFTLISFGGLYPLRGSRSITTDYKELRTDQFAAAGRLVGAGGFGAAYRTGSAYGSVGGVALVPFAGDETPRVFATSSGYWRNGATLDLYHFALVDLLAKAGAGVTNLSAGVNYKPNPRLRLTGSFNRVDVDTLNVQANAFLNPQDTMGIGPTILQNESYFRRLSTNVARVGISAGLGQMQRFELSTTAALRYRPGVTLTNPDSVTSVELEATKGADIYVSLTDRHSFKNLRLGLDASQSFAIGKVAFQRNEVLAIRGFMARELTSGKGEWEGEVSYAKTKDSGTDSATGTLCDPVNMPATIGTQCFGSANSVILSLGGNLYYRFNRDWYSISSLFLSRQTLTRNVGGTAAEDPPVTGLMAFFRIAYRF